VGQVSTAMGVVDQVTQRNASAAEELSSTAEEMSSQAEALQQLMGFFQVKEGHHAISGRAPLSAPPPPLALAAPPPGHALHSTHQVANAHGRVDGKQAPDREFRRF
jgi:methyl-accepting chemotaxis protein